MNKAKVLSFTLGVGALSTVAILSLVIPAGKPRPAAAAPTRPITPAPIMSRPAPSGQATGARTPQASLYMSALQRFEAEGKWADLGVRAFNEAPRITAADRAATIELLRRHQGSGEFPVLFCLARHEWFAGNKDDACQWYIKALVVYTIDAQRCTDPTARQAVEAVRGHFGSLVAHLKQVEPATRREWVDWAMDFEDSTAERPPARWIAAHGLAAYGKKASGAKPDTSQAFVTDAEWPAVRERARTAVGESMRQ